MATVIYKPVTVHLEQLDLVDQWVPRLLLSAAREKDWTSHSFGTILVSASNYLVVIVLQLIKNVKRLQYWNKYCTCLYTCTFTELSTLQLYDYSDFTYMHSLLSTTTTTTVLRPFVRDYPGELVPEETFTHPPSWSSSNLYQLLPSTMIHSSSLFRLRAWQSFAQAPSTFSLVYLLVLGPPPRIPYIFFTKSVYSFGNTCPYHHNLFYCSTEIISSIPNLCLNSLLGIYLLP